jgi:hypothetical protein
VKIDINLRGREWTNAQGETVYFNTIQGWELQNYRLKLLLGQAPPMPAAQAFAQATNLNEDEPDDLPF